MFGCGGYGLGGGFGMGLLGGALLGSALSPGYYGGYGRYGYGYDPYLDRPHVLIVQQPAYLGAAQPAAQEMSSLPVPGPMVRSSSGRELAHHALAPPSYSERLALYRSGYGPDPSVVCELWENLDTKSTCGVPGPCCPSGTPPSLLVPPDGRMPSELTDLYTLEQWLQLRQAIEAVQVKYQWHACPFFCAALVCVPQCLESSADEQYAAVFSAENARLAELGVYWSCSADALPELEVSLPAPVQGRTPKTPRLQTPSHIRVLAELKCHSSARQAYEAQHPYARRIFGMPYGSILYPARGHRERGESARHAAQAHTPSEGPPAATPLPLPQATAAPEQQAM